MRVRASMQAVRAVNVARRASQPQPARQFLRWQPHNQSSNARPAFYASNSGGQRDATTAASSSGRSTSSSEGWAIKLLYDGDCPLCMREVEMLQRRDAGRGRIAFVDIASPDYRPEDNAGISFQQAMERIHGVLPDGSTVVDIEVFRRCYEEVGLGWVYAVTKNPAVEKVANQVYSLWAKYRLPITGRPDMAVVLQEKKSCRAEQAAALAGAAAERDS